MNWWRSLSNVRGTGWRGGFALYDAIEEYETASNARKSEIFKESFDVNSLWEFPEICDDILDRLRRASPRARED
jgi:hypothetical protein